MPVQIAYTTPVTGAVANYHVVRTAMQDFNATKLTAQIASYVDKTTYDAQKQPVFIQSIEWPSLPVSGADVRSAIETLLIAPTSDTSSPTAARSGFASGTIVDSADVTSTAETSSAADPATATDPSTTGGASSSGTATDSDTEKQAAA